MLAFGAIATKNCCNTNIFRLNYITQRQPASKLKENQPQVKEPKSNVVVQLGPFYGAANDQFEMINWSEERKNGEK